MSKKKKHSLPVARGRLLQINIEGLNHDAEGVGRVEGFAVFVPGALPGDKVAARIISLQKNYARALLEAVIEASPQRTAPRCEYYDSCGGCHLQHLAYGEQLVLKRQYVQETLQRLAGLEVPVLPVLGMPDPWYYRNKAQVPVAFDGGMLKAGFFEKRSHKIVDINYCHIQHPLNNLAVKEVRAVLRELAVPVYNEHDHSGLVRHVLARTSFSTGELLVILVTNGRFVPGRERLVELLRKRLEGLVGIVQNINTRRGNAILGNEDIALWGRPYVTEELEGLTFHVSTQSFFQVNPYQTSVLYRKVKDYAALSGTETVFDLFSGIGTISIYLSGSAGRVVGVEAVPAAVADAQGNALLNNAGNVKFYKGLAEEIMPRLMGQGYKADVIVVDPPRKGCDEKLLSTMVSASPQRIIYVSCNPATLARDLKYLTANGYTVKEVQPVDMFPHTSHVEAVVLMCASSEAGKC